MKLPKKLENNLEDRKNNHSFRSLGTGYDLIDFYSNDYLGLSASPEIYSSSETILHEFNIKENGATGSRLLSGNHLLYPPVENYVAEFHNSEAALIFNSGYDANIGFFSCVPSRGDVILFDEYIHASIRDGIKMSNARAFKFSHNDLRDLETKVKKNKKEYGDGEIYIITESVFSMDGDSPFLEELVRIAKEYGCLLIVDEAHATGVFGEKGEGLLQVKHLENKVFARIHTFGKAFGCHGAVILGSKDLKDYLINFSRSFIYTTALPPHSLATIWAAYQFFGNRIKGTLKIEKLQEKIRLFTNEVSGFQLEGHFISSQSAIQSCIVPGNERVKEISKELEKEGFGVKAILSPTVPKGQERLRFCIHCYNSEEEIKRVLHLLSKLIK